MPAYIQALVEAFLELLNRWQQTAEDNYFYVKLHTEHGDVEVAAEVTIDAVRQVVVLWDVVIYQGKGANISRGTIMRVFFEALADLRTILESTPFNDIEIIGLRVPNSSSARPGHGIHISVDKRGKI